MGAPCGEDDEVGVEEDRVCQLDRETLGSAGDRGRGGREVQPDAPTAKVVLNGHGQFVIQRREDLVGHLDDVHGGTAVREVLGHLQPDVARPDDDARHRRPVTGLRVREGGIQLALDGVHVADAAQHVDARQVDAGKRGTDRLGACAEGECVVGLRVLRARRQIGDGDGLLRTVDSSDLVADANLDIERFAQALGGLQQQPTAIGDHSTDVVRQPAVRE